MWKIFIHDNSFMSKEVGVLNLSEEERVIYAAIRKGPNVHIGKDTSVRLIHVGEYESGKFLIFSASLMESTFLEAKYPEYSSEGIMGKWLLYNSDGKPKLKFLQKIENVKDFLEEAQSTDNPEWIRRSYTINELL